MELLLLSILKQAIVDWQDEKKRDDVKFFLLSDWCCAIITMLEFNFTGEDLLRRLQNGD